MKDLALRAEFLPQAAWNQIEEMTTRLTKGGALPSTIDTPAKLAMCLLAGYEAGMRPMESINAFYVVNGRLTIWGDAMIRQLKRAGYKIEWVESDDLKAVVKLTSPDGDVHTESFTMEEAHKAGVTGKDPWKKYPKAMLRWKAIGHAIRFFCPEVLGGVQYLKEEAEDFAPEIVAKEVPTVETTANGNPRGTLRDDQLRHIHAVRNELGVSEAELNGWVTSVKGVRVSGLDEAGADLIIDALRKKLELKKAAAQTKGAAEAMEQEASVSAPSVQTEEAIQDAQATPRTDTVAPQPAQGAELSQMDLVDLYKAEIHQAPDWVTLDAIHGDSVLDKRLKASTSGIIAGLITARRNELLPPKTV